MPNDEPELPTDEERELMDALGQLATEDTAPPDFLARVLAQTAQEPLFAEHAPAGEPPTRLAREAETGGQPAVQALPPRRPRRGLRAMPPWVGALAACLLLSVTCNVWLGVRALGRRGVELAAVPGARHAGGDLLTTLGVRASDALFHSPLFQVSLTTTTPLGDLVTAHPALQEQAMPLGFAPTAAFYRIGALYAEAVAYLHSDHRTDAAQRLAAIAQALRQVQVPSTLGTYLRNLRHLVEDTQSAAAVAWEGLALFQPLGEEYATRYGPEQLTLFRLGVWLVEMRLAAAAGDTTALRQEAKAQYFLHALTKIEAPPVLLEALTQMRHHVTQPVLTDADVTAVGTLVEQMQRLLG